MPATPTRGNGHGGERRNVGRPRAELTKARDDWDAKSIDRAAKDFVKFYDAISRLALGVTVEKRTDDGTVVYQMPPDFKALAYIFDRMAGKPKQAIAFDPGKIDMATAVELTNRNAVEYSDPDDEEEKDE